MYLCFLFLESLSIASLYCYFRKNYVGFPILRIEHDDQHCNDKITKVYGELQLFMNILSMKVADVAAVRVGLTMCGRRRHEHIESMKFEMSLFV